MLWVNVELAIDTDVEVSPSSPYSLYIAPPSVAVLSTKLELTTFKLVSNPDSVDSDVTSDCVLYIAPPFVAILEYVAFFDGLAPKVVYEISISPEL